MELIYNLFTSNIIIFMIASDSSGQEQQIRIAIKEKIRS